MFTTDFMLYGISLDILKISIVLLHVALAYIFLWKLYLSRETRKTIYPLTFIFLSIIMVIIFNSNNSFKRSIDVPVNSKQIEYKQDKEVVIETPPERTEKLDGFVPLKQE